MVMSSAILFELRVHAAISSYSSADRETISLFSTSAYKPRDLIKTDAQCHFGNVSVLDINGRTNDADVSRFELRQIMRHHAHRPGSLFVQIHRHVEVEIDNSISILCPIHLPQTSSWLFVATRGRTNRRR